MKYQIDPNSALNNERLFTVTHTALIAFQIDIYDRVDRTCHFTQTRMLWSLNKQQIDATILGKENDAI